MGMVIAMYAVKVILKLGVGFFVGQGNDFTLFAKRDGIVEFRPNRTVHIIPAQK